MMRRAAAQAVAVPPSTSHLGAATSLTSADGPLRVLVVDDERLGRDRLGALLARESDVDVVGECANGAEALELIVRGPRTRHADVVFLDVQMPDLDGIGVAEYLLECANEIETPELIFVTAYSDYMERAFELHAIDYLRKPYTDARFRAALGHARRRVAERRAATQSVSTAITAASLEATAELRRLLATLNGGRENDRIAIRDRATGTVQLIEARTVIWIAAHGSGQVRMSTHSGPILWHRGIETVDTELSPLGFLRVHRSTLINPVHLVSAKPLTKGQYMLTMSDRSQFDTGRAFAAAIEAHLARIPGGR